MKPQIDNMKDKANSVISGILKYFSWIIFVIAVAVLLVVSFVESIGIGVSIRRLALFALISSVCAVILYFTFQLKGLARGKETEGYIKNEAAYKKARCNRRERDVTEFISVCREREKQDYIKSVVALTGKTEADLRKMTVKELKKLTIYTSRQKRTIKNLILNKYPDTAPRDSGEVLNVISEYAKSRYGVKKEEKKRFLMFSNVRKISLAVTLLFFSAAIAISFVSSVNVAETLFKIFFSILSFLMSMFGGYNSGFKANAEIEKDILASMCLFLDDMDIWLIEQGKPTRYKPEDLIVQAGDAPAEPQSEENANEAET